MKKGISLIVLVITIIVMIIIAGAIILSLNSSNVTSKANWAKISSDRANLQSEFATIFANFTAKKDGVYSKADLLADTDYVAWKTRVTSAGFTVDETATDPAGIQVTRAVSVDDAKAYGIYDTDNSKYTVSWVVAPAA